MMGNVIVGQSGGPTAVINASLAGVYSQAASLGAKVFGMRNGIQGFLQEKITALEPTLSGEQNIELLRRTPSAYLGSCRYKLPSPEQDEAVYHKMFDILRRNEIKNFFYIGGNDSMDTINRLSKFAEKIGCSDIRFMGVPKTVDNDLVITDHTPGYGSAAKYIASSMKELIRDNTVNEGKVVTVVEIMGRDAGWLTGAAALCEGPDCPGPDLIYLPELPFDLESCLQEVAKIQEQKGAVIICISEGVRTANGEYLCELSVGARSTDAFGHKQLTGTARALADLINARIGCKVRAIEFSSLQRCAAHIASKTDNDEAFAVGAAAVKAAYDGHTGQMGIIVRASEEPNYRSDIELCNVDLVANKAKDVPREWINAAGNGVTPEFLRYARPLIEGEIAPFFLDGMPAHIPYLK